MDSQSKVLCDICKQKEATHHEIKLSSGVVVHMCAGCRAKLLAERTDKAKAVLSGSGSIFDLPKFMGLSDIVSPFQEFPGFAGFLAGVPYNTNASKSREDKICRFCGRRASDFVKTGFLGCDRCYSELSDTVLPATNRLQGALKHTGKTPYGEKNYTGNEYERLMKEYTKAMEEDKFEEAAVLKERMRAIKENT